MKKTVSYLVILFGLAILAGVFYFKDKEPLTDEQQRDFKVEAMADLDKISLKDRDGNQTILVKEEDGWHVEGKGMASKVMLNDLFYALEYMEAEYPVPLVARENVLTQMIAKSTKVSLFQNGKSKPFKEFTVGGPNHHQDGTYMLMEMNGQTADKPYLVKLPGFRGYITYRFSAITNYWMSQEFVAYLPDEIASVSLNYYGENKDQSYHLERKNGQFALNQGADTFNSPEDVNLDAANSIYATLLDLNFETYLDSIPGADTVLHNYFFADLKIVSTSGKEHHLKIYEKPLPQIANTPLDGEGNPELVDGDQFYAYYEEGDAYYIIQEFTFGNLFLKAEQLKKSKE